MKRWLGLVAAMVLVFSLGGLSNASAATSKERFGWHAGDSFGGFLHSPDVAMADNGDTVEIRAGGTMDAGAKTATGGGTFIHETSTGTLVGSGTLTATKLLSFQFYGCGAPFPEDFCGGRALIAVHLVGTTASGPVEADGILGVDCLIGSPPAGAREGVTLNVKGLINFNKPLPQPTGGETLFVLTP